jgi:sterol 3beta-glucosyltransferase
VTTIEHKHYGIVAIGSRGDVQPYVALALGLKKRGQEASLMAHENFKDFVESYGVAFVPIRGNVEEMLRSDEGMEVIRKGDIISFSRYIKKMNKETAGTIADDIFDTCKKADVLIASLLALPWVDSMAEKLGKRWALVQLNLPTVPTKAFPMAAMDFFDFPAYNIFTHRFFEFTYHNAGKKVLNQFRASLDLPKLRIPLMKQIGIEKIPNLHCFSPSLLARPADWATNYGITGFLFLPYTAPDNIPNELTHWLASGEKPVYIGFGSIPVPDPKLLSSCVKYLLDETNHRIIFCSGWSPTIDLPKNHRLYQLRTISHQWLLPQCKAAVIHGGVGTTAAVLQAKIPLVIVSIIADQPWWGKIIEGKKLGVHIPFKKLTPRKLADALAKTQTPGILKNAFTIGEQINREDGLQKTLDVLGRYFSA